MPTYAIVVREAIGARRPWMAEAFDELDQLIARVRSTISAAHAQGLLEDFLRGTMADAVVETTVYEGMLVVPEAGS